MATLNFSRYNTFAYNPAPLGGRLNFPLRPPELYDIESDPMEIPKPWTETQSRETAVTPAGALPRKK